MSKMNRKDRESPSRLSPTPHLTDCQVFRFNVSGRKFEILRKSLLNTRLPTSSSDLNGNSTLLERFASSPESERLSLADAYDPGTETFYFERSSRTFENIIDFYRHGSLHCPLDMCSDYFLRELQFWAIDSYHISPCCSKRLGLKVTTPTIVNIIQEGPEDPTTSILEEGEEEGAPFNPQINSVANGNCKLGDSHEQDDAEVLSSQRASIVEIEDEEMKDIFPGIFMEHPRRVLWKFLEYPHTSKQAKIFSLISMSFIVISVLTLIIGSMPEVADFEEFFEIVEYMCLGWFTFEFVFRFIVYPQKCAFLKDALNIIDLVSIAPFYIELLVSIAGWNLTRLENVKGALMMIRLLRVMRVARIFRLARYSGVMKSCGKTLRDSYREVGMLVIFVAIMIILFSTTVYFFEKDENQTKFLSIPSSFWWCVVTITTVGYGDMAPATLGGRIVASLASVAGVVVLAFPITVIVENFYRYYRKDMKEKGVDIHPPTRIRGVNIA